MTAGDAATPLCARHPDLPSAGTCARCGRFACEPCFQPERGLCVECARRTVDPLGVLGPFSIWGALASGWKLFAAARWTALGASVAMALVGTLTSALTARIMSIDPASLAFGRGATILIASSRALLPGTLLYGALLAHMEAAARGEAVSAWQAIARSARAWPRMFWAQLVAIFVFLLGLAALVIPGFYAAVALWLVMPAAYLEPGEPAVRVSSEVTRGRRWEVLALLLAARTPIVLLAGVRFLGVYLLVRSGYSFEQRTMAIGAISIPLELARCGVESFEHALTLAAYLGLRRPATPTA